MDNREVLLEVKNVSKIYGDLHALKDVSFTIRKGEWVAIMGSSGSGKSTIMNIIGCMDKPTMGEVILDGQDITKESQTSLTKIRREKIGLIFQMNRRHYKHLKELDLKIELNIYLVSYLVENNKGFV